MFGAWIQKFHYYLYFKCTLWIHMNMLLVKVFSHKYKKRYIKNIILNTKHSLEVCLLISIEYCAWICITVTSNDVMNGFCTYVHMRNLCFYKIRTRNSVLLIWPHFQFSLLQVLKLGTRRLRSFIMLLAGNVIKTQSPYSIEVS